MKEFKGRVLAGGNWKGEAVVSRQGVNTLATFQKSALKNAKRVIVSDQNNADIYGLDIEVTFLKKIRDEIRFTSFTQLKAQLARDRFYCKSLIEDRNGKQKH